MLTNRKNQANRRNKFNLCRTCICWCNIIWALFI